MPWLPMPPRVVRRVLAPLLMAVEVVLLTLAVLAAAVGAIAIVVDRRARLLRMAVMVAYYLCLELVGLFAYLGLWLAAPLIGSRRKRVADQAVLLWLVDRVIVAAGPLLGFRVELPPVPGQDVDSPFGRPEPVLVLARHGGIGDSFVLAWLLAGRYRRRPRVVLRAALLWDPLIDVALTRLGACWVTRHSQRRPGRPGQEVKVAATVAGLEPGDALLLFPEGGNWTERRRLTALARAWRSGRSGEIKATALMEHVLPPRPGGVLAALGARPGLPVVVVAHRGLDRITTAGELWRSLPFEPAMVVRWWPSAPVPEGEEARREWLLAEWAVVDEWIEFTS